MTSKISVVHIKNKINLERKVSWEIKTEQLFILPKKIPEEKLIQTATFS